MKIAITATGADLQAQVDPRFGRALYFIIIDPETMAFEAIENRGINSAHGAGIQAGQLMSAKEVSAIITGSVGPNAFQTLIAAGIHIFQSVGGTVAQAVEAYKNGQLSPVTRVGPAHAGMGGGMGQGRGMRAGMGMRPQSPPVAPLGENSEINALKAQAEAASQQLDALRKRIAELEKESK